MLFRTLATLALTISLAMAAPTGAVDRGTGDTLDDAQELVDNQNWTAALAVLKRVVAGSPDDPDALNLLAYVLRHSGDYLGELYALSGALSKARERLAMVEAICGTDCEEYRELAAAIEAAE